MDILGIILLDILLINGYLYTNMQRNRNRTKLPLLWPRMVGIFASMLIAGPFGMLVLLVLASKKM